MIFAPNDNKQYRVSRKKKIIHTRPIPESKIHTYENEIAHFQWDQILSKLSVDEQTETFHNILRSNLEKIFPEKVVKMSSLDQKWMTPELKTLHRKMQREYFLKRKSEKFKKQVNSRN